ncbi:MAG: hypothetical protein KH268_12515 [Clostridiales bacterium]|nr:hypothetical protein [Clostridiales bacterium]
MEIDNVYGKLKKDGREKSKKSIPAKDIRGHKNSLQLAAAGKDVRDCLIIFIFII